MKKPVENMLTSRIRLVFEDFEDPSADAGWKQLRKKYPERNRRPLILWLSSAAALLLLATGLWFVNHEEQMIALKPAKVEKPHAKLKGTPQPITEKVTAIVSEEKISSSKKGEKSSGFTHKREFVKQDKQTVALKPAYAKLEESPPASPEKFTGKKIRQQAISNKNGEKSVSAYTANREAQALPITNHEAEIISADLPQIIKEQLPGEVLATNVPEEIRKSAAASLVLKEQEGFQLVPVDPTKKQIKDFDPQPVGPQEDGKNTRVKKQKLAFSVFAGSHFNYSEGSESQLNFGAGIISDIRLNKNLKLSTGISIASNSLNYKSGQDLPENAVSSFHSVASHTSGNLTTITSYHANLLALDIPVNLKYQFIQESDKFYVSAGLNSGTYLNETYAYQYRNFNTASGDYINQKEDQKIKKQLNDFELGRTLNLSLGLSTGFGKTQTISIEPFLKYPLGGLGSENLQFGSTGVNLKLRFKPVKK